MKIVKITNNIPFPRLCSEVSHPNFVNKREKYKQLNLKIIENVSVNNTIIDEDHQLQDDELNGGCINKLPTTQVIASQGFVVLSSK